MLGVQLLGNETVTVKKYPEPTRNNENDLLIQVKASGICGSEMHGYRSPTPHASNGGHEVAGEVIDAGQSTKFKVGDHVGVHAVWGCGDCRWCGVGKYTYCNNRIGGGSGTHAERLAAPDHVCLKLPEDIPFDVGVLLTGDGFGVPYHVSQRLDTKGGDFVCVLGAGPVGLGNTIVQSFLGAEVIVIDINDYRLSLAKAAGAAHTVNSKKTDPLEAITEITHGMLVDKCIEAAGRPETLKLAFHLGWGSGDDYVRWRTRRFANQSKPRSDSEGPYIDGELVLSLLRIPCHARSVSTQFTHRTDDYRPLSTCRSTDSV